MIAPTAGRWKGMSRPRFGDRDREADDEDARPWPDRRSRAPAAHRDMAIAIRDKVALVSRARPGGGQAAKPTADFDAKVSSREPPASAVGQLSRNWAVNEAWGLGPDLASLTKTNISRP
jgi:hypothetical protein